ncbi:hypothetical protein DLM75_10160 [Leptospira stimsonii]|uniref:Uncharacterized protein n=1 Tax=Leptospira stimsonii TaxID=2202203 RepID=A0A396Z5H3_9LEPT|nr:hypothetical protein DLM75_10160 [Leptospira stimsonii]
MRFQRISLKTKANITSSIQNDRPIVPKTHNLKSDKKRPKNSSELDSFPFYVFKSLMKFSESTDP